MAERTIEVVDPEGGVWDVPASSMTPEHRKAGWRESPAELSRMSGATAKTMGAPDEARPSPGAVETFLRSALQGGTANLADEGSGAIAAALPFTDREAVGGGKTFGERYRNARGFYRGLDRRGQNANPGSAIAGGLTGGALTAAAAPFTMPARAAPGATLAQRAGEAAKYGAALGGTAGYGASESEDPVRVLLDIVKGAAGGAAMGALAPVGRNPGDEISRVNSYRGEKFSAFSPSTYFDSPSLRGSASERALQSMRPLKNQLDDVDAHTPGGKFGLGQFMLEEKDPYTGKLLFRPSSQPADLGRQFGAVESKANQTIGEIRDAADKARPGGVVDAARVHERIAGVAKPLGEAPISTVRGPGPNREAQAFLKRFERDYTTPETRPVATNLEWGTPGSPQPLPPNPQTGLPSPAFAQGDLLAPPSGKAVPVGGTWRDPNVEITPRTVEQYELPGSRLSQEVQAMPGEAAWTDRPVASGIGYEMPLPGVAQNERPVPSLAPRQPNAQLGNNAFAPTPSSAAQLEMPGTQPQAVVQRRLEELPGSNLVKPRVMQVPENDVTSTTPRSEQLVWQSPLPGTSPQGVEPVAGAWADFKVPSSQPVATKIGFQGDLGLAGGARPTSTQIQIVPSGMVGARRFANFKSEVGSAARDAKDRNSLQKSQQAIDASPVASFLDDARVVAKDELNRGIANTLGDDADLLHRAAEARSSASKDVVKMAQGAANRGVGERPTLRGQILSAMGGSVGAGALGGMGLGPLGFVGGAGLGYFGGKAALKYGNPSTAFALQRGANFLDSKPAVYDPVARLMARAAALNTPRLHLDDE